MNETADSTPPAPGPGRILAVPFVGVPLAATAVASLGLADRRPA